MVQTGFSYSKQFTDLPFAVVLEPVGNTLVSGRFLTAAVLGTETANPRWKTVFLDNITKNWVVPNGYDDPAPFTPAWQEAITGVPLQDAIRVAREFAENAEKTHGKSMIFLGAGTNHWYHSDMIYRAIINLTTLCGCQGVNGGGWAHYVGQEKVRPQASWAQLAFGLDWSRPPRQQNGTSFFYFATDQWRYDDSNAETLLWPMAGPGRPAHMADYNVIAV
ncbi:MAG: NarG, partial [uncultured bacterium]